MRRLLGALSALTSITLLSGCSLVGNDEPSRAEQSKDVVLVTHDSFALPHRVIADFEAKTGYHLVVHASGDGGTLTNKLVLTQGDPTGDVAFGVDNTFATRAVDAGVFTPYDVTLPAGADRYALPGDEQHDLAPIDNGNVCVNVDTTWFAAHDLNPPRTLQDLTKPDYRDLLVIPGAATSSTGLAFLLGTVGAFGDGWQSYWTGLLDNGAKLTDGWTGAYESAFTQGGGHGTRPIVVSYDSSPAFTVSHGRSTTKALLDTCFRQVEYAGVLDGATNPAGANAWIDFMLSDEVQRALPDSMYVFPVRQGTPLPRQWASYAVQPTHPFTVSPADITAHRDEWLRQWSDLVSR